MAIVFNVYMFFCCFLKQFTLCHVSFASEFITLNMNVYKHWNDTPIDTNLFLQCDCEQSSHRVPITEFSVQSELSKFHRNIKLRFNDGHSYCRYARYFPIFGCKVFLFSDGWNGNVMCRKYVNSGLDCSSQIKSFQSWYLFWERTKFSWGRVTVCWIRKEDTWFHSENKRE